MRGGRHGGRDPRWACLAAALLLLLGPASAAPAASDGGSPLEVSRILTGRQFLTADGMSEAYDSMSMLVAEVVLARRGLAFGFELGTIGGGGDPLLRDSSWDVSDASVGTWALWLAPQLHYNFVDESKSGLLAPYVATGLGLWIGGENLKVKASRSDGGVTEEFDEKVLGLGVCYGISAIAGTTLRISDGIRLVVEARYTLTTSGDLTDMTEEEDEEMIDATVYDAADRPGFEFTGWQIAGGVQW